MGDDEAELEQVLGTGRAAPRYGGSAANIGSAPSPVGPDEIRVRLEKLVQWTTADDVRFLPAARTATKLTPGLYDVAQNPVQGIYLQRVPVKTEGILRFPHTNSDKLVAEIQTFWARGEKFEQYALPHKRGIILWGPPGSGKSCTIQLVMADVIERGGIGIRFTHPSLFVAGYRIFREIQPETPVVVLMEDLDSIIQQTSESEVLNILDGAESIERAVFLASTNYPELLGPRIINRPSRFDRRYKIGHPTAESRCMYLEHLLSLKREGTDALDLDAWVADTEGFSFAHLKELFVAVVILEDTYPHVLGLLRKMKEHITSESDRERAGLVPMGLLPGLQGGALIGTRATHNKYR